MFGTRSALLYPVHRLRGQAMLAQPAGRVLSAERHPAGVTTADRTSRLGMPINDTEHARSATMFDRLPPRGPLVKAKGARGIVLDRRRATAPSAQARLSRRSGPFGAFALLVLDRLAEHHLAGRAQARPLARQAGSDLVGIRDEFAAQPHRVGRAGLLLLGRAAVGFGTGRGCREQHYQAGRQAERHQPTGWNGLHRNTSCCAPNA
jgi:hypothetical protein